MELQNILVSNINNCVTHEIINGIFNDYVLCLKNNFLSFNILERSLSYKLFTNKQKKRLYSIAKKKHRI